MKYRAYYYETHIFYSAVEVEANNPEEAKQLIYKLADNGQIEINFLGESDCINSGVTELESEGS